jgi:hypothetical protein
MILPEVPAKYRDRLALVKSQVALPDPAAQPTLATAV